MSDAPQKDNGPRPASSPAQEGPARKIPCWMCGGDLLLNYATVSIASPEGGARITLRTYCPRCRKAGRIVMSSEPSQ
jgi:ribosomal protein L33